MEVADLYPDPTHPAQWLLDRAAQTFNGTGSWPLFTDLKRELARRGGSLPIDSLVEIQNLSFTEQGVRDADEVVLNVAGLARTSPGRALLATYLLIIDLCVEKYLGDGPLEITDADLSDRAYMSTLIQRMDAIMSREVYLFTSRQEPEGGVWRYAISTRIEDFRVVTNLSECLEIRNRFVGPPVWTSGPRVLIAGIDTPEFDLEQSEIATEPEESVSTGISNPLLRDPSHAEMTLLDVIFQAYQEQGQWPIYQWVDSKLYGEHHLDAQEVLTGCPRLIIQPAGIGQYGWVRSTNPTYSHQLPGDVLSLSISGLRHVPEASQKVDAFLVALAYLVARERSAVPTPTSVAIQTVTSNETAEHLKSLGWLIHPGLLQFIGEGLDSEPSTWGCGVQVRENWTWTAQPDSFLRRYGGVTTSVEYVDRLVGQISPESLIAYSRPGGPGGRHNQMYDYFLSYASEDRDAIARPLHDALVRRGVSVWFDEVVLDVGQSLVGEIDRGLATCRFGIVILSPSFFAKDWPIYELRGLVQRMNSGHGRAILPVWHGLTHADVARFSPSLSDIVAIKSEIGLDAIADRLIAGTHDL